MSVMTKIAASRFGDIRFPKVDSPPGEVITYKLSPEEIEKLYGPVNKEAVSARKRLAEKLKQKKQPQPIDHQKQKGVEKQMVELKYFTKEKYLELKNAGKTDRQIINEVSGLHQTKLYTLKKAWGLIKADIQVKEKSKETSVEPVRQINDIEQQISKSSQIESDPVNHPPHYTTGGIETIDFIQAKLSKEQFEGYVIGNVLKYCSRARHKGGIEDLKKARWYLDRLIQQSELAKVE